MARFLVIFFFFFLSSLVHQGIKGNLEKKINSQLSCRKNPDEEMRRPLSLQAVQPEALNQELGLLNCVIWVVQNLLPPFQ